MSPTKSPDHLCITINVTTTTTRHTSYEIYDSEIFLLINNNNIYAYGVIDIKMIYSEITIFIAY